jgi:hypothetical protein
MPRLGDQAPLSGGRRETSAYRRPRFNTRNVLLLLVITFVVRNIFFRDYRTEQISELTASGMTKEEVELYVPTTAGERRKYVDDKRNDFDHMKKDIAFLLQEVHELRGLVKDGKAGVGGVDEVLTEMDKVHEEKRRRREEAQGLAPGVDLNQLRGVHKRIRRGEE